MTSDTQRETQDEAQGVPGRPTGRPGARTIEAALSAFLAEQAQRLSPKSQGQYRSVVGLLTSCLDTYGAQDLGPADRKVFEAAQTAGREFCGVFGPERIPGIVSEFLGYFMVRKVVAGKHLMRAAGTVTKKLARWLEQEGHISASAAESMYERAATSARELPRCADLRELLHEFARSQWEPRIPDWLESLLPDAGRALATNPRLAEIVDKLPDGRVPPECEDEVEDRFEVLRVEPGRLHLQGWLEGEQIAVPVPQEISSQCRAGMQISGVIGQIEAEWRLVDVYNVYPAH